MLVRHILLYIFLFLFSSLALAAGTMVSSTNFRFRHYTVEDGLSANSIRSLIQDRRGYIWIGTENGLNCFDGISVRTFTGSGAGHPRNSSFNTMCEVDDGTIWLGTDIGVFCYFPDTDSFCRFDRKSSGGTYISSIVYAVQQDKDQNLWFATYGQGVFKYNAKHDELTQYRVQSCYNNMYTLLVDSDNNVWVTGNSPTHTAIYRLNKNTDIFEPFKLSYPRGGRFSNTLVIYEDASGWLWLGTRENGVQRLDKYSGEVDVFLSPAQGNGIMHIHNIVGYDNQVLMIGSDDGLTLLDTTTGEHKHFLPEETNPFSLSNRFVYPITRDREGGLWIGTYYGGVNYVSPRNGQFENFVHTRYANSVGGTIISCFAEDSRGNVWIGSDDGGVSMYTPQTGRFVNYLPDNTANSLSYHNVHALCFDGDDLWIGTYSGGLNVLNTRTGRFRHYQSTEDVHSLDQNSIYSIFRDRESNIWVTTMTGVNLYNRAEDNFHRVKDFGYVTMDICQDHRGDLWFATQGKGVFRFNLASQSWKNYRANGNGGSLAGNMVNCLLVDSSGDLWVGTSSGISRYVSETDSFETVDLGTEPQTINCIIEDNHRLWITTGKGLIQYMPGEGSILFSQSDGLQSELFLPSAGMKASDGKIYLGTVNGFNAFYPHRIRRNEFVPPVVLTGLEIFNREIQVSPDGLLTASLDVLEQLDLSHGDNVFGIRYAALSYSIPGRNRYAYMLEGFDKEWNYVGNQSKATYTNLPAGTYTFRVKAANNDGIWNEQGANLKIVIHPPFYLTVGFKVIYALLVLAGLLLLFRFLLWRTERKHQREMSKLNRRKEKEMHEAKISFFTMIAHEIRTPVSLIIGPLEKIMSVPADIPELIRNDLDVIDRNSHRLLSLVNQLLDFRKVEREGITLRLERCNLYELIKSVSDRFRPWVTQKGTTFTVSCADKNAEAVIDREAVTKLISNLLTNASKYTRDEVSLSCTIHDDCFVISVRDNGCGISPADQEKIFKPFYQGRDTRPGTGIGLSIVRNIVDAHNGTIQVRSEVGKGSEFIVRLALEREITELPADEKTPEHIPAEIVSTLVPEADEDTRLAILVVDDNEEMLSFLSSSLVSEYQIITAIDGVDAWEKMKETNVSMIVSDWMMPNMNGVEFCRKVRSNQATSHIPFILLTAKSDVTSKIEAMDFGADAYIEKPFSLQYLKSCIRNLLDLREMLYGKFTQLPLVPLKSIAANQSDEKFLERLNGIIEDNFSNPELSVDFLADKLGISRSGLFAKIRTLANVTPNELIQLVRLKKGAQLLAENNYKINEICYMVGFSSPSYFSKCFQKQFGMKPGEFLKELKDEN